MGRECRFPCSEAVRYFAAQKSFFISPRVRNALTLEAVRYFATQKSFFIAPRVRRSLTLEVALSPYFLPAVKYGLLHTSLYTYSIIYLDRFNVSVLYCARLTVVKTWGNFKS